MKARPQAERALIDFKKLFDYCNGKLYWKENHARVKAGDEAGTLVCGYVRIQHKGKTYAVHHIIWGILNGPIPDGMFVDHHDGVRNNNDPGNLRLATRQQNNRNRSLNLNSTTGLKGVTRTKNGMYRASISVDGAKIFLGTYADKNKAGLAYYNAAKEYFGEFAK
jgi:hypothetical protein